MFWLRRKIESANGDERILDGLECSFSVENLKIALFCNTFIYKLKVFCSPRLKSHLLRLYNVWNLFKEITNEFVEKTPYNA